MEILSQHGAAFTEIRSQISTNHEDNDKGSAKATGTQPQENNLEAKDNSIYTQGSGESDLPTTDVFEARTDRVSTPFHTELNVNKEEKIQLEEKQQEATDTSKASKEDAKLQQSIQKFQDQLLTQKAQNAYISQSKVAQWNYNPIFKS